MYYVSTQGVDERMINVHYYYLLLLKCKEVQNKKRVTMSLFLLHTFMHAHTCSPPPPQHTHTHENRKVCKHYPLTCLGSGGEELPISSGTQQRGLLPLADIIHGKSGSQPGPSGWFDVGPSDLTRTVVGHGRRTWLPGPLAAGSSCPRCRCGLRPADQSQAGGHGGG